MAHKVIPMLRIFDYNKAIQFYINWLGFTLDWEDKPLNAPVYLQVSKQDITLHLTEHHGDCTPGSKVFIICTEGLREYHRELLAKDYMYNKPGLELTPWNALAFTVIDPFGNQLFFNEYLPATATI